MPEDIKKVILVTSLYTVSRESYLKISEEGSPALDPFLRKGSWSRLAIPQVKPEVAIATLLTGSSPQTHRVEQPKGKCHAEYFWEAAQRSSKKTVNFGVEVDRTPMEGSLSADPAAVASFLRTSPTWDICLYHDAFGLSEPSALAEIFSAADEETLLSLILLPSSGEEGFFGLAGPGVKKGFRITRVVRLLEVIPTICYLGEISVPAGCEGGILYQALEDPDMKVKELRACRRNYERLRRSTGPSAMC
jgi:hypothetical protein